MSEIAIKALIILFSICVSLLLACAIIVGLFLVVDYIGSAIRCYQRNKLARIMLKMERRIAKQMTERAINKYGKWSNTAKALNIK